MLRRPGQAAHEMATRIGYRSPTDEAHLISAHRYAVSRTWSSFLLVPRMHRHLPGHSCEDSRSPFSCRPHRKHWHLGLRSSNSNTAGEAGCIAMQPAHHAQTRVLAFEQASPASAAAAPPANEGWPRSYWTRWAGLMRRSGRGGGIPGSGRRRRRLPVSPPISGAALPRGSEHAPAPFRNGNTKRGGPFL
jgi:hypothetical protein